MIQLCFLPRWAGNHQYEDMKIFHGVDWLKYGEVTDNSRPNQALLSSQQSLRVSFPVDSYYSCHSLFATRSPFYAFMIYTVYMYIIHPHWYQIADGILYPSALFWKKQWPGSTAPPLVGSYRALGSATGGKLEQLEFFPLKIWQLENPAIDGHSHTKEK